METLNNIVSGLIAGEGGQEQNGAMAALLGLISLIVSLVRTCTVGRRQRIIVILWTEREGGIATHHHISIVGLLMTNDEEQ
jgi:hypothetical protein